MKYLLNLFCRTLTAVGNSLYCWLAGRSRYSSCWLGQHRWDMPGGHCERCGICDEFFGQHNDCHRK